jgi:hypothetical protein
LAGVGAANAADIAEASHHGVDVDPVDLPASGILQADAVVGFFLRCWGAGRMLVAV